MTTPAPVMTNRSIGELIGCTHSMVSRIRAGKRLPGVEVLMAIQAEFDIPLSELMAARLKGPKEFSKLFQSALAQRAKQTAGAA